MALDGRWRDARWYLPEFAKERHRRILEVARRIWTQQGPRRDDWITYASLYGNRKIMGLGPRSFQSRTISARGAPLAFNVIKSCCDTYVSGITKDKPKASFQTSGADWTIKHRAQDLERFCDGQFYETDLYELGPLLALDSAVYGSGILKVYAEGHGRDEHIEAIRRDPWQVLADDEDAAGGRPRTIYERIPVDRRILIAEYPDFERQIEQAARGDFDGDVGYDTVEDQIYVTEAYHLPSGPKAGDGRHCIVIDNATLYDEPYERDRLPFFNLRRQRPQHGWYGTGLAEDLCGIQYAINLSLCKIQESFDVMGGSHWLVNKASKVNTRKLSGLPGTVIEYIGLPPQAVTPSAVHPEQFQHLDRLFGKAFEITGVPQMQAQSQVPAGLHSGKALRTYADLGAQRFQVSYGEYHAFFLDVAKEMVALAREISERNPSYSVKATRVSRGGLRIKWRDVDLKDDEYVMRVSASRLSDDPAERFETVQEWANAGWLGRSQAFRLLDFPDLEAYASYETASYDLVMRCIERMIIAGEYIGPEPYMQLAPNAENGDPGAIRTVQQAYIRAKLDGVPEERLELLRRWMSEAAAIISPEPETPPAPPQGAPAPGPQPPAPALPPAPSPQPAPPQAA